MWRSKIKLFSLIKSDGFIYFKRRRTHWIGAWNLDRKFLSFGTIEECSLEAEDGAPEWCQWRSYYYHLIKSSKHFHVPVSQPSRSLSASSPVSWTVVTPFFCYLNKAQSSTPKALYYQVEAVFFLFLSLFQFVWLLIGRVKRHLMVRHIGWGSRFVDVMVRVMVSTSVRVADSRERLYVVSFNFGRPH